MTSLAAASRRAPVFAVLCLALVVSCAHDASAPTGVLAARSLSDRAESGGDSERGDTKPNTARVLSITAAPTRAIAGVTFDTQPVVELRTANGALLKDDEEVTVTLAGGLGRLSGHTTVHARAGVARFTDLRISAVGSYTLTFAADNFISASVTLPVIGANDFSIAASPWIVTMTAGSSTSITVSTAVTSGLAQTIVLSVSGLPAGVTGSISPATITAGGSATLTLNASSAAAAAAGVGVTVTGVSGANTHAVNVLVTVTTSTRSTFSGAIAAISPPTLTVGAFSVMTSPLTTVTVGGIPSVLSNLRVGTTVTVTASTQPDGTLLATSIDAPPDVITGIITSLSAPTLTVAGTTVQVSGTTTFGGGGAPGSFTDLLVGESVIVSGAIMADGSLIAASIAPLTLPPPPPPSAVTITGTITALTGLTLTVGSTVITTNPLTGISVGGVAATLADLRLGQTVTVVAEPQSGGVLLATTVTVP
jgi:hypothetical protein